jgi:hypothetical protein
VRRFSHHLPNLIGCAFKGRMTQPKIKPCAFRGDAMNRKYFYNTVMWQLSLSCVICLMALDPSQLNQALANELPSTRLEVPSFFYTTKAIKGYFDQQGVPAEVEEIHGKYEQYCFIKAFPYSGIDTTDLYCCVNRNGRWTVFLKAYLFRTPPGSKVEFKTDGDFMDVVCKGVVVLNPTSRIRAKI